MEAHATVARELRPLLLDTAVPRGAETARENNTMNQASDEHSGANRNNTGPARQKTDDDSNEHTEHRAEGDRDVSHS